MQRALQTYGNRALQRALDGFSPLVVAQRQASEGATSDTQVKQALPVRVKGKPHSVTHHGKVALKLTN